MKFIKLLVTVLLLILIASCGSKKKTLENKSATKTVKQEEQVSHQTTDTQQDQVIVVTVNKTTQDYIDQYADIAMLKMRQHNIPASITLAQGVLESSSGNSRLTKQSNNHFGIKCHKEWEGKKVYWDDDTKGECFRVYDQPEGSFEDHSQFLVTRSRYAPLFQLNSGDYVGWAYGLKKAGYATDPAYPQKLIGIIERYKLYDYDKKVLGKEATLTVVKFPEEKYVVQKGDGLYKIANKYNMTVMELKSINRLTSDNLKVGQVLYVKKSDQVVIAEKTNITEPRKQDINTDSTISTSIPEFHMVEAGETLYAIAKKYQLNVDDLKNWNNLEDTNLSIHQKLYLGKKTVRVKDSGAVSVKNLDVIESIIPVVKDTIVDKNVSIHEVQKGEGLYSIAKKYGVTVAQIKEWNGLTDDTIQLGQMLKVKAPETQITEKEPMEQPKTAIENQSPQITKPQTHVVQKGETFYEITYKYNLEIPYLRKINHLTHDEVYEGQVLNLTDKPVVDGNIHIVQKGETLYSISRKYGVSVDQLIEWNTIQNNTILEGQSLKIK